MLSTYHINALKSLTIRVIEGSEDVPVEHLQNFIQHSINVFPKCLNKEYLYHFFNHKFGQIICKSWANYFEELWQINSKFWAN